MEAFKTFTYWWVGINIVGSILFSFIAMIFGGRDLVFLLKELTSTAEDEADDGRALE